MASGNESGGNPFDPCRQWLGISALELDDPRKLLGLDSVDDPIRILQAAELRLARLRGVEAGPYEMARRALISRVEEARDRLLTSASAMPSPPALPGSLSMPPSPTAALEPSDALDAQRQAYPIGVPETQPYRSQPEPVSFPSAPPPFPQPPFQQHVGQPPYAPVGSGQTYRRSAGNGPLLFLVAALFTAVAGLAIFALQLPPVKPDAPRQVAKKQPKPAQKPMPPGRHPLASRDRPFNFPEDELPEEKLPEEKTTNRPQRRDDDPPETMTSEPPSSTEDSEPQPPVKTPEPPADEPDPLAKIDAAVKQALEALLRREYDTAERVMKAVEGLAPEQREANRIAGWLQLAKYSKGFYDYRDQAMAAVKHGDEYDIKTKKIAVIDVTDGALTVKVAGEQKTWHRDDIPGAVMQAIVESWFDDNPANQLYLGAYHFTKPEPDPEKAEACWSKAMIGGADASLLLPLLTDPVVVDADAP